MTKKTAKKTALPTHFHLTVHLGEKVVGRSDTGHTFTQPVRKTWSWVKGFETAAQMLGATVEAESADPAE